MSKRNSYLVVSGSIISSASASNTRLAAVHSRIYDSPRQHWPCLPLPQRCARHMQSESEQDSKYQAVTGSTTPAATVLDARRPSQCPLQLATVPSTCNLVYRSCGGMRNISGATSAQAVGIQQPQAVQHQQRQCQCSTHLSSCSRPLERL